MSLQIFSSFTTQLLFSCLVILTVVSAAPRIMSSEDENQTNKLTSSNNQIQELREPISLSHSLQNMGAQEELGEDINSISDHFLALKRRIGLTMPNILHAYAGPQGGKGLYDPMLMQKRRIGLRLPNIIYMRDLEKRMASEWSPYNN
uniref:Uncharacterized protein n=1 Tax=Ditylenchus dipsaci TaxID=166011 RepID=A0A915DQE5_9BILA